MRKNSTQAVSISRYNFDIEEDRRKRYEAAAKQEGFSSLRSWIIAKLDVVSAKYAETSDNIRSGLEEDDIVGMKLDDVVETIARLQQSLGRKGQMFAELQLSGALAKELKSPARTNGDVEKIRTALWDYVLTLNGALYDRKEGKSITISREDLRTYARFLRLLIQKRKLMKEKAELGNLTLDQKSLIESTKRKYADFAASTNSFARKKELAQELKTDLEHLGNSETEISLKVQIEEKLNEFSSLPEPPRSKVEMAQDVVDRLKRALTVQDSPEIASDAVTEFMQFMVTLGDSDEDGKAIAILKACVNSDIALNKNSQVFKFLQASNALAKLG